MAEPAEGTYYIVNVASSKAMDVASGLDKSGTNVRIYTLNRSEAQIWALSKPEGNSFQIICSLTGKCLDVQSGNIAAYTNIRQWDDNNSNAQRWNLIETDAVFTFEEIEYPVYEICPKTSTEFAIDLANGSATNGTNIRLYNVNHSNAERWIFIPASVFSDNGTYEIVPARDTSVCLSVASRSTANSASIKLDSFQDSNHQVFRTVVDSQTKLVRFYNANSEKVIDVRSAKTADGTDIIQYSANNTAAQNWLPMQVGTVKIGSETMPTYELHAQVGVNKVMDCSGGKYNPGTNIQLYTKNNTIAQRFCFIKSEKLATNIEMPSKLSETEFSRDGAGTISLSNLAFRSTQRYFQARYKIKTYGSTQSSFEETEWKALLDGSTSREGWGDAWDYTFEDTLQNGTVILPYTQDFELSEEHRYIDVIFEIRAYLPNYESKYKAHSATQQSIVRLSIRPILSLSAINLAFNNVAKSVTLNTKLSIDGGTINYVKGQLYST